MHLPDTLLLLNHIQLHKKRFALFHAYIHKVIFSSSLQNLH